MGPGWVSAAKETLLSCSAILRACGLGIGTLICAGVLAGVGGTLPLFSSPGVPGLCSQGLGFRAWGSVLPFYSWAELGLQDE